MQKELALIALNAKGNAAGMQSVAQTRWMFGFDDGIA
jgi:hypothetical protein